MEATTKKQSKSSILIVEKLLGTFKRNEFIELMDLVDGVKAYFLIISSTVEDKQREEYFSILQKSFSKLNEEYIINEDKLKRMASNFELDTVTVTNE